jgi:hypothetical protein
LSLRRQLFRWLAPGLALPMLALVLVPTQVFKAPVYDEVYRGFDENLIATSGSVHVAPAVTDINAIGNSIAAANLATTLRQTLDASVDVTVLANDGATQPFRIGVWSPWTGSGYFVAFGPAPNYEITIDTITGGDAGPTLIGGDVVSLAVGQYQLRNSYHITLHVDRAQGVMGATVSGPGAYATDSLAKSQSPSLFGNVQLSMSASAVAGTGTSRVAMRNFVLTMPHERVWTATVSDLRVKAAIMVLAILGFVALLLIGISLWRRPAASNPFRLNVSFTWVAFGAAVLYVAGNAALFRLGGHPFDFGNEQLYAYVAKAYGPTHLYFIADVTSLAGTWNGVPWIESSFPYEPLVAYLFTGIGLLSNLIFGGVGLLGGGATHIGLVIKSVNVAFGLADTALIYLILRQLQVGETWSRLGAAFFLFNPAVWFSMSVWGQTHVFSIFFVLLAILFAEKRMPFWAWLALAAAVLTRPQMTVFGLLLGTSFLRKFTWRENLDALSRTVIVTFVTLLPLTLATSPSLPVDIFRNVFSVQEAGGNEASLTTVSQSAYSVWPLVTYIFHGASGIQRAYTPSASPLIGSITYQSVSQVLTVTAMLLLTGAILFRKRSAIDSGAYLPLVAVGVATFLMLLTGIVATHFLLALPLFLLCRRWMDPLAYCFVAAIWTISTLVPMYGDMGTVISGYAYPLLAAANNPVTRFFVELYTWDRFITVAIVANICAIVWLAILAYREASAPRTAAAGASGLVF